MHDTRNVPPEAPSDAEFLMINVELEAGWKFSFPRALVGESSIIQMTCCFSTLQTNVDSMPSGTVMSVKLSAGIE